MAAKKTKTQPTANPEIALTGGAESAPETGAAASDAKAGRSATKGKPGKTPAKAPKAQRKPAVGDTKAKVDRKPRTDTKQAKLIAMLQAKDGATVEEIASAFGWQNHTVRGSLYGALKKKLGLDIVSEKVEGRGRVYRIGN